MRYDTLKRAKTDIEEALLPGNEDRFDKGELLRVALSLIESAKSSEKDAWRAFERSEGDLLEEQRIRRATESDLEDVRKVCERVAYMPRMPWSNEHLVKEMAELASTGI